MKGKKGGRPEKMPRSWKKSFSTGGIPNRIQNVENHVVQVVPERMEAPNMIIQGVAQNLKGK